MKHMSVKMVEITIFLRFMTRKTQLYKLIFISILIIILSINYKSHYSGPDAFRKNQEQAQAQKDTQCNVLHQELRL